MIKKNLHLFILFIICNNAFSQKVAGEFSFNMIADNREYFNEYVTPQTILGARINAHGGLEFDSCNSVFVGGSFLYEFGHRIDGHLPVLDLFYNYHDKHFNVYLGSFPRKGLLHYPLIMLADSVEYYRPNIQGGLGQLRGKWGHQSVWIDWTSRQTENVRETFLTGVSGIVKLGSFFIEDHFHYWHRAGMANDSIKDIRDNNSIGVALGFDASKYIHIDSITLSSGLITTSDKIRPADAYKSKGWLSRFALHHKWFGLDVAYYMGDAPSLEYGDRIYTSKNYLRTDIIWRPFTSQYVKSKVAFGIHVVNGEVDFSQQILVAVRINNKTH